MGRTVHFSFVSLCAVEEDDKEMPRASKREKERERASRSNHRNPEKSVWTLSSSGRLELIQRARADGHLIYDCVAEELQSDSDMLQFKGSLCLPRGGVLTRKQQNQSIKRQKEFVKKRTEEMWMAEPMLQSKYVVVEVTTTTATMTLVQYLITHGFDKFTVVSDLYDHPSLKGKGAGTPSSSSPPPTTVTPAPTPSPALSHNGKQKMSINDIASNLSKRSTPQETTNGLSNGVANGSMIMSSPPKPQMSTPIATLADAHSHLARMLENKAREKEQQAVVDVQKIILGQTALEEENDEPHDEDKTDSSDSVDFGLGPSDDSIRASLSQLSNLSQLFGFNNTVVEETTCSPARKRGADGDAPERKKHRWMTNNELEESRFGRGKNYGRVHCKATYKCALCGKPTTLNSTGSRWNLLRHVIMIHSESKPYQCFDCDFIGIKSNVVSHARQNGHRCDDAMDITTDDMRSEWNQMLHACFPDYVKAKSRGWQPDNEPAEVSFENEEKSKIEV